MKTNIPLKSSLRKPFSTLLLVLLFGLISFGFISKAIEFILVQRETGVLGSYYRSIGILKNAKDPESYDVTKGIDLIKTSPYFAYGDQRLLFSGVMPQTYNQNFLIANFPENNPLPKEYWPNTHNTDIWFSGELIKMEEVKTKAKQPKDESAIGYYLRFTIDTLFAAYPEYASQGQSINLLFIFEGNEAVVPLIQEIKVGQRYFIRGWENPTLLTYEYGQTYGDLQIKPLDDGQLLYIPLDKGESVNFSDPDMAPFKNQIDVLNENLHTLGIIATTDMSAMPRTQEASRYYYLTEGRWLNHQDDLAENKVIVVGESFARLRNLNLGDEITLTFRPLKDTYYGYIRDGIDSINWRSYPTYQDTFKIVGLYNSTNGFDYYAYIPTSSLRPSFASTTQNIFRDETDYSFVLDSSRYETQFIQAYNDALQSEGISLTFLPNNGPAYWAAADPIRRSASADVLVFGLLMIIALSMAVSLYILIRKHDFAILRALGVPAKQASGQLTLPLLLLGGLGIIAGGLPSWNYTLNQVKATLSALPTPAGVTPSAQLSPFILPGLCGAIFLLLAAFSWLAVFFLAHRPIYELLQGQSSKPTVRQKQPNTHSLSQPTLPLSPSSTIHQVGSPSMVPAGNQAVLAPQRKYTPFSLYRFVIHHLLRSRIKSLLTLVIALSFMLASGWILRTIALSGLEIERLYATTEVDADIIQTSSEASSAGTSGFISQQTIDAVLNSGFVKNSILQADTTWAKIKSSNTRDIFTGIFAVYAYDSPETFYSSLADPSSLIFVSGWDRNVFAKQWTLEDIQIDGIPALFPQSMLEQLQLDVGQMVTITDRFGMTYSAIIIGQYSGGRVNTVGTIKNQIISNLGDPIIIPLSVLECMEGIQTKYTVAHFTLDPIKNRELPQLHSYMENVMIIYGGKARFIIWDEELRIVIAQLDKNLSLLKVLYPVVLAVSVLIGAGMCFLLLLQATKEAAIMRVLGTTKTAVRLALIAEPLFLSIIGTIIGLGTSLFLWTAPGLVPAVPLLSGAGLYLAGVLAGLVIGAISVTNKKPIELLQVKE